MSNQAALDAAVRAVANKHHARVMFLLNGIEDREIVRLIHDEYKIFAGLFKPSKAARCVEDEMSNVLGRPIAS